MFQEETIKFKIIDCSKMNSVIIQLFLKYINPSIMKAISVCIYSSNAKL